MTTSSARPTGMFLTVQFVRYLTKYARYLTNVSKCTCEEVCDPNMAGRLALMLSPRPAAPPGFRRAANGLPAGARAPGRPGGSGSLPDPRRDQRRAHPSPATDATLTGRRSSPSTTSSSASTPRRSFALTRAIAVAELDGPQVALAAVNRLQDKLVDYHACHVTRAGLLRPQHAFQHCGPVFTVGRDGP
jgi:hypothetical protein